MPSGPQRRSDRIGYRPRAGSGLEPAPSSHPPRPAAGRDLMSARFPPHLENKLAAVRDTATQTRTQRWTTRRDPPTATYRHEPSNARSTAEERVHRFLHVAPRGRRIPRDPNAGGGADARIHKVDSMANSLCELKEHVVVILAWATFITAITTLGALCAAVGSSTCLGSNADGTSKTSSFSDIGQLWTGSLLRQSSVDHQKIARFRQKTDESLFRTFACARMSWIFVPRIG
jgi:hypothetical protein